MRLVRCTAIPAVAATLACSAQDPTTLPDSVRAAAGAIDSAQLRADVTYLASDELLGRDTPSPGQDSAAAYVERRLATLGLQPAGDNGGWRQHYGVRTVVLDTVATYVEVGGRRFRYGTDFLVAGFPDSGTATLRMTYAGHGVRAPKKHIDPYAGVTTRGRMVIVHGPGIYPRGETFQSLGAPLTDWLPPQLIAAEQGAAALVHINPPRILARWTRGAWRANWLKSRELWPSVPSAFAAPAFPVLWVGPAMGNALLASAPDGAPAVLAKADRGDFAPSFELPAANTATVRIAIGQVTMQRPYNIVARIEGSDRRLKAEAVVLAAHLDGAVGAGGEAGGADARDVIYNAADDNASGSAGLLAVAAAMMRAPRPRRTVIFVWDTGEEIGLWGSRYFAANPPVPLANVVTYFNVDMIGRTKQPGTDVEGEEELAGPDEIFVAGPRAQSSGLDSLLERTNRTFLNMRVNHTYDLADHEYFYPRTDAAPLVERGVLTVNYMNNEHGDYHGVGDESAKLDLAKMTRVAKTIFAGAWMVASVRARPLMDKPLPATVPRYE
jgi:hypothetical protein